LKRSSAIVILQTGLLAGTLDITYNLIFNQLRGITPTIVFHYIASGLIGTARSLQGGMATVVLGVMIHYLIALTWTAVFYTASRKLTILLRRPVICGLLYGGFVYLFMNLIVLPLSAVPHIPNAVTLASRINGVIAVMFCIGLTISLMVRRSSAIMRES
jgi:membrane protein YqaA with SNARE-associated domain